MTKINVKKTKREKDSTVSVTPEAHTKKITDIESLMERIEDYSEYLGIMREPHPGPFMLYAKDKLHDFSSNVKSYVIKTIELSPHKTILKEMNDFLQFLSIDRILDIKRKKGSGGIERLKKVIKDYDNLISSSYNDENNISELEEALESLLLLFNMYIEFKYEDKEIHQENKFEQCAVIIRLLYAWLMGFYNTILQKVVKKDLNNVKCIWALTYEIGLLQGKICLIESLLDQDLIEIHRSKKSSKDILTVSLLSYTMSFGETFKIIDFLDIK